MLLNLYDYLVQYVDFDFFGGLNMSEISILLVCLILSCIVAFLPIALVLKIVRRVN